jgi:hypothetical protein
MTLAENKAGDKPGTTTTSSTGFLRRGRLLCSCAVHSRGSAHNVVPDLKPLIGQAKMAFSTAGAAVY